MKTDATDKSPGFKFAEQEMRGIPVRIECGPKDIEANQAVVARRDTGEKIVVALPELAEKVTEILDTIQTDMLERARAHRDAHTYTATTYEEFVKTINEKPGFIKAMWCGDQACEDKIKEDTAVVSHLTRNIWQIPVYAVENRRQRWYTGAEHTKRKSVGTSIKAFGCYRCSERIA